MSIIKWMIGSLRSPQTTGLTTLASSVASLLRHALAALGAHYVPFGHCVRHASLTAFATQNPLAELASPSQPGNGKPLCSPARTTTSSHGSPRTRGIPMTLWHRGHIYRVALHDYEVINKGVDSNQPRIYDSHTRFARGSSSPTLKTRGQDLTRHDNDRLLLMYNSKKGGERI